MALDDGMTFGDYVQYGLVARNTFKQLFQIRIRLGAVKRRGAAGVGQYSTGAPLPAGVELCYAPLLVAPWTDADRLSRMHVEIAAGKGVPADQCAYALSGPDGEWAPCVVTEVVERDDTSATPRRGGATVVKVAFLGSDLVENRPVDQVRFLFPENTLIHGEASELMPDEMQYVYDAWKQRTGTKRIVEEINRRRGLSRRPGMKATRVSEKAVENAVEEAKAQVLSSEK